MRGKELGQVAILLPNAPEMVASMLASLKARKAYVPLDYNFPRERLQKQVWPLSTVFSSEARFIHAIHQNPTDA